MTTTITPHVFGNQQLRHTMIEGDPWFHAADVCKCIGLGVGIVEGSTKQWLGRLDSDERQHMTKARVRQIHGSDMEWPNSGATVISESGLYKLIMRSDKQEARTFQDWITREVLPSIRKTGGYLLNEQARETAHADTREAMPLPAEFMDAFRQQGEQIKALASQVTIMSQQLRESGLVPDAGSMWVTKTGKVVLIRDMETTHLAATLNLWEGTSKHIEARRQMRLELQRRSVEGAKVVAARKDASEKMKAEREAAAAKRKAARAEASLKKAQQDIETAARRKAQAEAILARVRKQA